MARQATRRIALGVALAPLACVLAFALAALGLGMVAVNRDFRPSAEGITIYLRHNGIHTDFILPVSAAAIDWRPDFPGTHFAPPAKPLANHALTLEADMPPDRNPRATHIAFGWGDQGFYFDTPTWSDLSAGVALRALGGFGASAMHVEYLPAPARGDHVRRVTLSNAQYLRLASYIRRSFRDDANGRTRPFAGRGYTMHDAFYAARGSFSLFTTCNEWVRRGLADAGVRTPVWAPFHHAIFAQLS